MKKLFVSGLLFSAISIFIFINLDVSLFYIEPVSLFIKNRRVGCRKNLTTDCGQAGLWEVIFQKAFQNFQAFAVRVDFLPGMEAHSARNLLS